MYIEHLHRRVGWFVILGVAAVALVVVVSMMRSDIFAEKFSILFSPPSAAPFYEGQEVKFQGFTIGRIDEMVLKDDGVVDVRMQMLERYHSMLHEGSIVHLVGGGLIGEQTLEITAGDKSKPLLRAGAKVRYENAATFEQLLQDLNPAVKHANILLKELASLATWLNDPASDVRQVTARLNAVSQGLNRQNVTAVVTQLTAVIADLHELTASLQGQQVSEHLAEMLQVSSAILNDLKPLSAELGRHGGDSLAQINALVAHLNQLAQSLEVVASSLTELTPELPGLARDSRTTIRELHGVLEGLHDSWLIGGGAPVKEQQQALPLPAMGEQP